MTDSDEPIGQPPARQQPKAQGGATGGLPPGIDPLGVPTASEGREAFVMTLAIVVALLGLCLTLGWVVLYRLSS